MPHGAPPEHTGHWPGCPPPKFAKPQPEGLDRAVPASLYGRDMAQNPAAPSRDPSVAGAPAGAVLKAPKLERGMSGKAAPTLPARPSGRRGVAGRRRHVGKGAGSRMWSRRSAFPLFHRPATADGPAAYNAFKAMQRRWAHMMQN